jgi:hypothetical protein
VDADTFNVLSYKYLKGEISPDEKDLLLDECLRFVNFLLKYKKEVYYGS